MIRSRSNWVAGVKQSRSAYLVSIVVWAKSFVADGVV